MKPLSVLSSVLIFISFTAGCGQTGGESSPPGQLPMEATITLEEVASLASFGDHFIDGVRTPFTTENGDLILSEFNAQKLFRISADGELLQTIGRDGRGPGEFQSIYSMLMAPGDSLHVFDINNMRHQIFGTDGSQWSYARELQRERPSAGTEGLKNFAPSSVFGVDNELFGFFQNDIVPGDTATMYQSWISRVDHNLHATGGDPILLKPSEYPTIITFTGNSLIVNTHPFSYRLFRSWNAAEQLLAEVSNNDAVLRHYNLDGEEVRSVQLPYEKRDPDLEARSEYEQRMAEYGNDAVQTTRSKHLPFEPLISNMLIDDEGRYWLQMSRLNDDRPNWIVFSAKGELIGSLTFVIDFESGTATMPMLIRNNRLYAMHYEDLEPSFRIYDIQF